MGEVLKILVVDDDSDAADSLAEVFEMEGHDAHAVYSGDSAIENYLKGGFDVAFMDIMMPGRNGVESFIEIKRFRPDAKVYMMTGFSANDLIEQAVDNGAMGVFSKPVDLEQVVTLLEDLAA